MERLELTKLEYNNVGLPSYDINNEIIKGVADRLMAKFDTFIIEGLKRKGFDFDDKKELEKFLKEHCTCEDNTDIKEKIYRVNDIPFLLHNYNNEWNLTQNINDDKTKFTVSYGHYAYL